MALSRGDGGTQETILPPSKPPDPERFKSASASILHSPYMYGLRNLFERDPELYDRYLEMEEERRMFLRQLGKRNGELYGKGMEDIMPGWEAYAKHN